MQQKSNIGEQKINDNLLQSLKDNSWKSLTVISLYDNLLTSKSVELLKSFDMPELILLGIGKNLLDSTCGDIIVKANWPSLKYIRLQQNNLGNAGVQSLSNFKQTKFCSLNIASANITNVSLYKHLTNINLNKNSISRKGVKSIVKSMLLNLKQMDLKSCNIDDQGLVELSKGKWDSLSRLNIQQNNFGIRGIKVFTRFMHCNMMRNIYLDFTENLLQAIRYFSKNTWNQFERKCRINFTNQKAQLLRFKTKELNKVYECSTQVG